MRKIIYILAILFFACNEVVDIDSRTPLVTTSKTEVGSVKKVNDTQFSNPAIIYGTDFGNFFNTLYRQGKFEDMIKFTSKESIDLHSEDEILDFYKNRMKFGYEIGKAKSQNTNGDYTTLNYDANIIATKRVIRIIVKIENDSCKIVLPEKLKNFPS